MLITRPYNPQARQNSAAVNSISDAQAFNKLLQISIVNGVTKQFTVKTCAQKQRSIADIIG